MRWVIVRVLPVPAPASTHTGPRGALAAARCSGPRPSSKRFRLLGESTPVTSGILAEGDGESGQGHAAVSWSYGGTAGQGSGQAGQEGEARGEQGTPWPALRGLQDAAQGRPVAHPVDGRRDPRRRRRPVRDRVLLQGPVGAAAAGPGP